MAHAYITYQTGIFFHTSTLTKFIPFCIFFSIFAVWLLKFIASSNVMPRYLYSLTIGYPSIYSFFFSNLMILAIDLVFFLKYNIPDFFLLTYILAVAVHLLTILIAFFRFIVPFYTITKSSAYAIISNPAFLSSTISS